MASRIAVLQSNSSLITHHIKRSTARKLVVDLLFAWVIEGVSIRPVPSVLRCHDYGIPGKMPPAEVAGCHFKLQRRAIPAGGPPGYIRIPLSERQAAAL